jgi:hypothetical protein
MAEFVRVRDVIDGIIERRATPSEAPEQESQEKENKI